MNARITTDMDARRERRREVALVAQYIRELSDRHAGARFAGPPAETSGAPGAGALTADEARAGL